MEGHIWNKGTGLWGSVRLKDARAACDTLDLTTFPLKGLLYAGGSQTWGLRRWERLPRLVLLLLKWSLWLHEVCSGSNPVSTCLLSDLIFPRILTHFGHLEISSSYGVVLVLP